MTTVELAVAALITGILLAGIGACLVIVVGAYGRVQDTSLAHDQGRVLLDRLDRDLRQVSAINRPRRVGARWYLEYLTDIEATGMRTSCTQWRLDTGTRRLDVRTWTSATVTAPGWSTVSTAVTNDATTEPPFTLLPAGAELEHQQLAVRLELAQRRGTAVSEATLAARNSSTGSASNPDVNGDGVSDTEVCTTYGRP